MNFLKPKKGQKGEGKTASQLSLGQLPPLPTESELYSELPNLPEAPEAEGLPDIELPQPLKGLGDFELPESMKESSESSSAEGAETPLPSWLERPEQPQKEVTEEDLRLLKAEAEKGMQAPWTSVPSQLPELRMFGIGQQEAGGRLISYNNAFFLKAEDFGLVKDNLDHIARIQKKHHRLTEIKKEENSHYEHVSLLAEELQRRLMQIDKTLFEQQT